MVPRWSCTAGDRAIRADQGQTRVRWVQVLNTEQGQRPLCLEEHFHSVKFTMFFEGGISRDVLTKESSDNAETCAGPSLKD